jgi:hypothetical protein
VATLTKNHSLNGDTFVESHPFDSAQGRLLRTERARMGHPPVLLGQEERARFATTNDYFCKVRM